MARTGSWRREFSAPLQVLQHELNRLFDEYWSPERYPGSGPSAAGPVDVEPASWNPAIDLIETPDAYVLLAEVPGVDPSSIELSVTGNVLTLRGIKPVDPDEPPGLIRERSAGPFHRQVVLSTEVDFDATQAEARHGLLRIHLPKREAARPRTIPVQPR
ncbi:MAG: Hsp20/alpha crystallin family protein [Isosphaeraceae bacterium]